MKKNNAYDHKSIEEKWKTKWFKEKIYDGEIDSSKPKFYALDTFVYPSGKGVTIGHYKSFGGIDIQARYKRMKGFNVLYPTGWDTFGLPAENFAMKSGRHPRDITDENKSNFVHQYQSAGLSHAWNTEINTSEPEYYRWTQWLFLQLYKNGLAYKKKSSVTWCPEDKTVLSKEQVINRDECERCGSKVEEKELEQWFFKVSDYAERMYEDCDQLDWEERHLNPHKAWIGRINKEGQFIPHVHDWCISRQRYWGTPIPIVYCDKCGERSISEDQLPVELPYEVEYFSDGTAPLESNSDFVNTTCPSCGGKAKRETDTMDTFVSSSWYQFRFTDPNNQKDFASQESLEYWHNVDHYAGTIEHLTAHLVYARFITKVFFDLGLVPFDEPFPKYTPVGLLVDKSGVKFSKRFGNAPETNELLEKYGGDLLRLSVQFITPYGDISKWSEENISGVKRFRDRFWRLFQERVTSKSFNDILTIEDIKNEINKLIVDIEHNIEQMKYNVALSKLMVFVNNRYKEEKDISKEIWEIFTKLLAPFIPFIAEEMWSQMGNDFSVHQESFPKKYEY